MHIEFNSSPAPSLGVEVELELVDHETGELVSAATDILAELGRGHPEGEHPKAKHELFECTIEIITGICETVAEARADLTPPWPRCGRRPTAAASTCSAPAPTRSPPGATRRSATTRATTAC